MRLLIYLMNRLKKKKIIIFNYNNMNLSKEYIDTLNIWDLSILQRDINKSKDFIKQTGIAKINFENTQKLIRDRFYEILSNTQEFTD